MNTVNRLLCNICSDQLVESKNFYTKLFDFRVDFDSDWFVHLISEDQSLELGIISRNHEIVPIGQREQAQGFYLTIVVDDVDEVFDTARLEGLEIVAPPEDTFYGQRRLLIKDPNGMTLDISAPIPNFSF